MEPALKGVTCRRCIGGELVADAGAGILMIVGDVVGSTRGGGTREARFCLGAGGLASFCLALTCAGFSVAIVFSSADSFAGVSSFGLTSVPLLSSVPSAAAAAAAAALRAFLRAFLAPCLDSTLLPSDDDGAPNAFDTPFSAGASSSAGSAGAGEQPLGSTPLVGESPSRACASCAATASCSSVANDFSESLRSASRSR